MFEIIAKNAKSHIYKTKHMRAVLEFLLRFNDEGNEFLKTTVTGDKMWISHITPQSNQLSLQWWHTGSLKDKKF